MTEKEIIQKVQDFFKENPFVNLHDFQDKITEAHKSTMKHVIPAYEPIDVKAKDKLSDEFVDEHEALQRKTFHDESTDTYAGDGKDDIPFTETKEQAEEDDKDSFEESLKI